MKWESRRDPEPEKRRKRAPAGKLDAVSVMLHEIGHALAFNGWLDQKTRERGGVLSTYDRHVIMKGGDFVFNGPAALKLQRKPVPLAKLNNNYHHVGTRAPECAPLRSSTATS